MLDMEEVLFDPQDLLCITKSTNVSIVYNVSFQWLTHFKKLKSLKIDYGQDSTCI
jgi:hypothetical protein